MGQVIEIKDFLRRKTWDARNEWNELIEKANAFERRGLKTFSNAIKKGEDAVLGRIADLEEKSRQHARAAIGQTSGTPVMEALKNPPILRTMTVKLPPNHIDITG